MNKEQTEFGLVITDWKTNKPKNFEVSFFTKPMKYPFQNHPNNALGHYFTQLPFYGKLILKMLEGTKYENIKLYGCIIVLIKEKVAKIIINSLTIYYYTYQNITYYI
jgi:hypothetical protein